MIERKKLLVFFAISFLLLGVLLFYIFRPLINTILSGFVFSYLVYPIYLFIYRKTKKPRLSSFLVCLLFIVVITLPILMSLNSLTQEVISIGKKFSDTDIIDDVLEFRCDSDTRICNTMNRMLDTSVIETTFADLISEFTTGMRKYVGEILLSIPSVIINIFIILFMMYYLLIDGKLFLARLYKSVPVGDKHKVNIFRKTKKVLGGILYGNIFVGAIQGFLGGVGFYMFGIKAPIVWGIIMFLFSFLPFIGTAVIWFPAAAYLIITSFLNSDPTGLWMGIGLLVYCALFVSTIDNFIRPKLVSNYTNIHPVLILFGVLGGIVVFKAAGIIIGPLIVGLFITLLDMFEQEKDFIFAVDEHKKEEKKKKSRKTQTKKKSKKK